MSTAGSTSSRLESVDADFLRKAADAGRAEVDAAEFAMQSAQRAEVRNAASMMLEDHRRANQQLEQLAKTKGWDMPDATVERDQSMTKGSDFDAQYVEQQIRAHREAIAMFRAQAAGGSDPELVRFAQDTLPTLEHHLEMLQSANTAK
jgi:putative membrane protein